MGQIRYIIAQGLELISCCKCTPMAAELSTYASFYFTLAQGYTGYQMGSHMVMDELSTGRVLQVSGGQFVIVALYLPHGLVTSAPKWDSKVSAISGPEKLRSHRVGAI